MLIAHLLKLSAVIDERGSVAALENSTPGLQFGSTIWTYMTSHILGIYPLVIVILVHSQKSYIDNSTSQSSTVVESLHLRLSSNRPHASGEIGSWGDSSTTRSGPNHNAKDRSIASKTGGLRTPRNHVVELIQNSELEMHSLSRRLHTSIGKNAPLGDAGSADVEGTME